MDAEAKATWQREYDELKRAVKFSVECANDCLAPEGARKHLRDAHRAQWHLDFHVFAGPEKNYDRAAWAMRNRPL